MKRTERSPLILFSLILGPLLFGTFTQQANAESRLTINPTSVNFGSVPVNTLSSSQAITLLNTSNRNMEILQAASSVPQFAVSGPTLPVSVAPGQGVSFLVVFTPNAAVKFSGSINFSIQGRDASRKVSVSGTGLAPPSPPQGPVPPGSPANFVLSGSGWLRPLSSLPAPFRSALRAPSAAAAPFKPLRCQTREMLQ